MLNAQQEIPLEKTFIMQFYESFFLLLFYLIFYQYAVKHKYHKVYKTDSTIVSVLVLMVP